MRKIKGGMKYNKVPRSDSNRGCFNNMVSVLNLPPVSYSYTQIRAVVHDKCWKSLVLSRNTSSALVLRVA